MRTARPDLLRASAGEHHGAALDPVAGDALIGDGRAHLVDRIAASIASRRHRLALRPGAE